MVNINSQSLNGLRGLAAMHVALGHFFVFSQEPTQGTDFIGGVVMPLFFLLSGFVMVVGYGRKRYKNNPSENCACCCFCCDKMHCCFPQESLDDQAGFDENNYNPGLYDDPEAAADYFPTNVFYKKRAARLAPVYYFTNLVAAPVAFLMFGVGFFILTAILSLFMITSWLLITPLNGVLWTISTMSFFYCIFPHVIIRLQRLRLAADFRKLAWKMYWIQVSLFFLVMIILLSLGVDFFVAYFIWRMFPPNRLPVFVMGCCIGYMRILANKPPTGDETTTSPEQYDHIMSKRPFCVSRNNVTTPAIIYGFIVIFGILFHFVSPTLSLLLRVFAEPILPLLFFDWILNLTKQPDALTDGGNTDVSNPSVVERFLQSKFMLFMGKISLSFYACHLTIAHYTALLIRYCEHGSVNNDTENSLLDDAMIPSWAIVIVFPLSILVGWLITTYIETPMQKWLMSSSSPSGPYTHVVEESLPAELNQQQQPANTFELTTANILSTSEEVKISSY